MELNLSKKQWEAWRYLMDNETSEIGYGGAAGWGKSYLGVMWVRTMANKYPWTRRFFWRKELTNLKKSTLNSYYKFLQDYKIAKKFHGKFNSKDNIIKLPNLSEILLLDCSWNPSDPLYTRFGSLELTGGFIDESNEIQEQCVTILSTRVGRQRNTEFDIKPKILETFNPDKWHVYLRFYRPYKAHELPDYRKFIPALVTDNKYIDPNYIQQLQKADQVTRQRLLFGNFDYDDTNNRLFRYDEVYDLFRNNIEKDETTYISADIARFGDDRTVIVLWRGLEAIKFFTYQWQTLDQTADKIKELEEEYDVRRNNIVIDSDGVGGWVCDMVRWCYNFVNNASAFKSYAEKNNQYVTKNFANLKTQCYFKLKEVMERRLIRINAEWQLKNDISMELDNILIDDRSSDQKTRLESKDNLKQRLGKWASPDYGDAVMFRMIFLVREEDSSQSKWYEWVEEIDYSGLLS